MRAIALAKYCKPDEYEVATLPTPEITKPDEVLIKVHAASVNPVDVKLASGMMKAMKKDTYVPQPRPPCLVGMAIDVLQNATR